MTRIGDLDDGKLRVEVWLGQHPGVYGLLMFIIGLAIGWEVAHV